MQFRKGVDLHFSIPLLAITMLAGSVGCGPEGHPGERSSPDVHVAAASSMQFVLPKIGAEFTVLSGTSVTFSFASSGAISSQIRRGAPIDLFCSADSLLVNELEAAGVVQADSKALYAVGELVLAVKSGPGVADLKELETAFYPDVGLANPDLAPYGRAAREALSATGVWEPVSEKAIYGENVGQVLAHFTRGNVSCAFLPLSLARQEDLVFVRVDSSLYSPIEHLLAIPISANNPSGGQAFADFLRENTGRAILQEEGFGVPAAED